MASSSFDDADFRISSFSGGDAGTCIEVAGNEHCVAMRDSDDPEKQTLVFRATDWASFIKGVKAGEFDFHLE